MQIRLFVTFFTFLKKNERCTKESNSCNFEVKFYFFKHENFYRTFTHKLGHLQHFFKNFFEKIMKDVAKKSDSHNYEVKILLLQT